MSVVSFNGAIVYFCQSCFLHQTIVLVLNGVFLPFTKTGLHTRATVPTKDMSYIKIMSIQHFTQLV